MNYLIPEQRKRALLRTSWPKDRAGERHWHRFRPWLTKDDSRETPASGAMSLVKPDSRETIR
jgi:hypothetical protein